MFRGGLIQLKPALSLTLPLELGGELDAQAQLLELLVVDGARRAHHQVLGLLVIFFPQDRRWKKEYCTGKTCSMSRDTLQYAHD